MDSVLAHLEEDAVKAQEHYRHELAPADRGELLSTAHAIFDMREQIKEVIVIIV